MRILCRALVVLLIGGMVLVMGKAAASAAPGKGGWEMTADALPLLAWQRSRNTGYDYFAENVLENGHGVPLSAEANGVAQEDLGGRAHIAHRLRANAGAFVTMAAGDAPTQVPAPATLPLLGSGLFGLALLRCRRAWAPGRERALAAEAGNIVPAHIPAAAISVSRMSRMRAAALPSP